MRAGRAGTDTRLSFQGNWAGAPSAPKPQSLGPLDFLADGLSAQQAAPTAPAAIGGGFEPTAFGAGAQQLPYGPQQSPYGVAQPPPQLQQPVPFFDPAGAGIQSPRPYMGSTSPTPGNPFGGGYGGYPPQPTGYAYAPQTTGYGYAAQMTGHAGNMALVPAGKQRAWVSPGCNRCQA
mgnify:FL=1